MLSQMENSGERFTLPNGQTVGRIEVFYIAKLLQIGSIVGAVVCLITLTWSGLQWLSAKKDKAKRVRAKKRMLWSLGGLVATSISTFILAFL
jgi:hypothetical protein